MNEADRTSQHLWEGAIRETVQTEEPTLVVLSSIDWEYLWQRPQHLAEHFASLGCQVVYVQRTARQVHLSRLPSTTELKDLLEQQIAADTRRDGNVTICHPLVQATVGDECLDLTAEWLKTLCRTMGISHPVFWVIGWHWGEHAQVLQRLGYFAYDCVDDLANFAWATPAHVRLEKALLAHAGVVFGVSRKLERLLGQSHPRVHRLGNGVDPEPFFHARLGRDGSPWKSPVIGYVGAVAEWVDMQLVADAARARPGWTFVIVGSVEGGDPLPVAGLANVVMMGRIPYSEVPGTMAAFDVGIVPFHRDRARLEAADSIKIYEYIAAGLPVVSTPFAEVTMLPDLVHVAEDADAFVAAIEAALRECDEPHASIRRAHAQSHSWRQQALTALGVTLAYWLFDEGNATTIDLERLLRETAGQAGMEASRLEIMAALAATGRHDAVLREFADNPDGLRQFVDRLLERGSYPAALAIAKSQEESR